MNRFSPLSILAFASLLPCLASAQTTDSGAFLLKIRDASMGTIEFKNEADGSSEFTDHIDFGGQKADGTIRYKLSNGKLASAELETAQTGKLVLVSEMGKFKLMKDGKKIKDLTIDPKAFPIDNYSPHNFQRLLASYDIKKGGVQPVKLLVLNSFTPIAATLEAEGAKPRKVNGETINTLRYALTLTTGVGPMRAEIVADTKNKPLLYSVAAQNFMAVRKGWEALAEPETPADPLLSKPTYQVKAEKKVMVKMRDGVLLAADIYRPDGEGKFPVILTRTCYGRQKTGDGEFYAKRGYVFVIQDVRGKFDSEGKWEPFVNEGGDGNDTVEWCANQPWSNGKVGMIGGSYLGFTQWAAARENNPHLACLVPIVSPPDPFFNIPYAYGAVFLQPSLWWSAIVEGKEMGAIKPIDNVKAFFKLPLRDIDVAVLGHKVPFWRKWMEHETNDAFWDRVNFGDKMKDLPPIPALHVSGWFDGDGIGTKRNYAGMIVAGQKNQKLIYGPWTHAVNSSTRLGNLDFGPTSIIDLDTTYLRWFDRWLKGIENGIDKEPSVMAFTMGSNQWRKFDAWPPKEAKLQAWNLHTVSGKTGKLSPDPVKSEAPDHFTYDPARPFMSGEEGLAKGIAGTGDHLLYESGALKNDVTVAGPVSLKLYASTTAKDTDFFAYVADVGPNGKVDTFLQGIVRARYRNSYVKPEMMKPGEIVPLEIDLWALGHTFKKGHQIRLFLASSCFPIYDRNLNTGESIATGTRMAVAKQTIYHDATHPSHLLLPVLPN